MQTVAARPLSLKIYDVLANAPSHGDAKEVFLAHVWPKLEGDYALMVQELSNYCNNRLKQESIVAKVDGRAKTSGSINGTMKRREKHREDNGRPRYQYVSEIWEDMHDLAGIRILADFQTDLDRINELVGFWFIKKKEPNIFHRQRDVGKEWKPLFGAYASCNHHVALSSATVSTLRRFGDVTFEVQVTSLAEGLYNKLAQPLLYKGANKNMSRKDEMVIDMTHGISLLYSICLLYMQDKLDEPVKETLRQAVSDDSTSPQEALTALANSAQSGLRPGTDKPTAISKTMPLEQFRAAMLDLPGVASRSDSPDEMWQRLSSRLEEAVKAGMQSAAQERSSEMNEINKHLKTLVGRDPRRIVRLGASSTAESRRLPANWSSGAPQGIPFHESDLSKNVYEPTPRKK
ncbi:vegetative incompatibility HET-E-1 [Paramyrothecium foliicola]|nr:vegetative incompatibility HET-E-1 [Paramyrothecium foliicola]